MTELATIARPYAEALFKAARQAQPQSLVDALDALAVAAGSKELRRYVHDPNSVPSTVCDVIVGALEQVAMAPQLRNLLRIVVDNRRLEALPEIAIQYRALVNTMAGVSDAAIHSPFPLDGAALSRLVAALEKRFARKLNASVVMEPELIGGIRVVVGDEVLDTSVRARLEQMKVALAA